MHNTNITQFLMFRGVNTFAEEKNVVNDLTISRVYFFGKNGAGNTFKSTQRPKENGRAIHPNGI